MYDVNSGYIGYSRSVRSQEALDQFEIPLSHFNRKLINDFLINLEDDDVSFELSNENRSFLESFSVSNWKYIAKHYDLATSWHHTGKYFQETEHYSLYNLVEFTIENKDKILTDIKNCKSNTVNISFGYIEVQVWGGSRKRPKFEGYETRTGIVKGSWLYYLSRHTPKGSLHKYKIDANKVVVFIEYNSYEELVKKHKEFKNTKRVFNKIIKSLTNKPKQKNQ